MQIMKITLSHMLIRVPCAIDTVIYVTEGHHLVLDGRNRRPLMIYEEKGLVGCSCALRAPYDMHALYINKINIVCVLLLLAEFLFVLLFVTPYTQTCPCLHPQLIVTCTPRDQTHGLDI